MQDVSPRHPSPAPHCLPEPKPDLIQTTARPALIRCVDCSLISRVAGTRRVQAGWAQTMRGWTSGTIPDEARSPGRASRTGVDLSSHRWLSPVIDPLAHGGESGPRPCGRGWPRLGSGLPAASACETACPSSVCRFAWPDPDLYRTRGSLLAPAPAYVLGTGQHAPVAEVRLHVFLLQAILPRPHGHVILHCATRKGRLAAGASIPTSCGCPQLLCASGELSITGMWGRHTACNPAAGEPGHQSLTLPPVCSTEYPALGRMRPRPLEMSTRSLTLPPPCPLSSSTAGVKAAAAVDYWGPHAWDVCGFAA